jgi:methionyl aminopeptidase
MAQVEIKSEAELAVMRDAGRIVSEILDELEKAVAPGVSTWDLDQLAEKLIYQKGAKPAFKGYRGFPACLCASVNHEVVHGIPSKKRKLVEGDLMKLDFGVVYKGFYGDSARTVPVGKVSEQARKLIDATRESLYKGIEAMVPGNRLGDVGHAVQKHVEDRGFSVVRDFVGHGIGKALHELPQVPNFGEPGDGMRLRPGMVIALEPMVNLGTHKVEVLDDDWTAVTLDGKLSAHFEHTIAITEQGPEILTRPA